MLPPLIVEWGNLDANALQRYESGLLLNKCDISAKRTWKEFMGSNEAVNLIRGTNPILESGIAGIAILTNAGDLQGLAVVNNGQRITSLANLAHNPFGHDVSVGLIIIKDPKTSRDESNAPTFDYTATHYQFCLPQPSDPAALAA